MPLYPPRHFVNPSLIFFCNFSVISPSAAGFFAGFAGCSCILQRIRLFLRPNLPRPLHFSARLRPLCHSPTGGKVDFPRWKTPDTPARKFFSKKPLTKNIFSATMELVGNVCSLLSDKKRPGRPGVALFDWFYQRCTVKRFPMWSMARARMVSACSAVSCPLSMARAWVSRT